jgi:EmrB/QacA subfamily drug resistance transporter
MCVALALVVSAVASLNIALPGISTDLDATQTDLQWMVDAYALVFAALLLPAGALGDRFGRKGVLVTGLTIFGGAYLVGVFATDTSTLIAARAVAGIGAAAIMPATLSIITNVFAEGERDRAVGIWAGVAGAGAILGLVISGVLLEFASWEWVFAVNALWAAVALGAALHWVPTSSDPAKAPLDPIGTVLSATGIGAIVFAIIEAPHYGWLDSATLGIVAAGIALIAGFVAWELRREQPMLDPRLFRERGFSAGTLAITVQFFAMFGFIFVLLQYTQYVLEYSPLEAAAAMLPMAATIIVFSRKISPQLAARRGPTPVLGAGLAVTAAGLVILSTLGVDSEYWHLFAGLLVLGTGIGLATAPATTVIVSALPQAKQGVASAVNDTARELGGALGIAVLGSVLADIYASGVSDATQGLPEGARASAADSIGFVSEASARFGDRGADLLAAAQQAFVDGVGVAFLVGAAVLALGAVAVLVRGPRRASSARPAVRPARPVAARPGR